ncbi:hypothetical protein ACFLV1_02335 [Chloroflexota bacterium]
MQKYKTEQDENLPDILKETLSQANQANKLRNKILHSFWHKGDTKDTLERIKRQLGKKGLKIDTEQVNVQELLNAANFIEYAAHTAQEFTWEILSKYTTYPISPADRAVFSDARPEFTWKSVDGAVGYELIIAKMPDFIESSVPKMEDNCIRDIKYLCKEPLDLNATYYWKVRPIIATAQGYWSEVRAFTVK